MTNGLLPDQHLFDHFEHSRSLNAMAGGADPEVVLSRWNLQFREKHGRQVLVVVLARVDYYFFKCVGGRQCSRNGGGLHELGARANDRSKLHHALQDDRTID